MDDGILGLNSPIMPEVSIKFNDEIEMFDFYKRYGYYVGFPFRKRNS